MQAGHRGSPERLNTWGSRSRDSGRYCPGTAGGEVGAMLAGLEVSLAVEAERVVTAVLRRRSSCGRSSTGSSTPRSAPTTSPARCGHHRRHRQPAPRPRARRDDRAPALWAPGCDHVPAGVGAALRSDVLAPARLHYGGPGRHRRVARRPYVDRANAPQRPSQVPGWLGSESVCHYSFVCCSPDRANPVKAASILAP